MSDGDGDEEGDWGSDSLSTDFFSLSDTTPKESHGDASTSQTHVHAGTHTHPQTSYTHTDAHTHPQTSYTHADTHTQYPQTSYTQADTHAQYPQTSYTHTDTHTQQQQQQQEEEDEIVKQIRGKTRREMREKIVIVDVNADDALLSRDEWMTKTLTEEKFGGGGGGRRKNSDGHMPSAKERQKHQITFLAHQAKERELELKNSWAQNRVTKMQTQAKYGF